VESSEEVAARRSEEKRKRKNELGRERGCQKSSKVSHELTKVYLSLGSTKDGF